MRGLRTGVLLAGAAVVALGPRLVLTFLAADRHVLDERWTTMLLVASGVGTALVLTAGNIYLAHASASLRSRKLTILWWMVLACSGLLAAPLVVAGLKGVALEAVLGNSSLQWMWSLLAVVATELIAGGCMLADAARGGAAQELAAAQQELAASRDALLAEQQRSSRAEELVSQLRQQLAGARRPIFGGGSSAGQGAEAGALKACPRGCGYQGTEMQVRGHQRACPGPAPEVEEVAGAVQ